MTKKTKGKTEPNELRGGLEPVRVRKTGKGMGVVEIPVHVSDGPVRLPDNEADYLAPARPNGREQTEQEFTIRRMYDRGFSVEKICVATGCHQIAVCKFLGLPLEGKEYDITKQNLEERRRV